MPEALPALLDLSVLYVALGMIILAALIVKAFFGIAHSTIGKIPILKGFVNAPLHKIEQKLNSYLQDAAGAVSEAIGASWSVLARTTLWTVYEIAHVARGLYHLAEYVTLTYPLKVIHAAQGDVRRWRAFVQRITREIERRIHAFTRTLEHPLAGPIGAGVKAGTRGIDAGLGRVERWIGTEGRWIEQEVAIDIPRDIADLRARDLGLARLYHNLLKWIRRHDHLLGAGALTAAVAIALRRFGAQWIRCDNWRKIGRTGCRMPFDFLDDILKLLVDFTVLTNICRVIPWLEAGFEEVAVPLVSVLTKAGAGLCGGTAGSAPSLAVPALRLPAIADTALHLP